MLADLWPTFQLCISTPRLRMRLPDEREPADLAEWSAENWSLGLGVLAESGAPLGMVTVRARDFAVVREVATSSRLGRPRHRKGFGSEARLGLLTLAFDHLGAEAAVTEVFQDNHASQGVSRKLGYEPDGIFRNARAAEVLVSDRLRLTRSRWQSLAHPRAVVAGIAACRHMFAGTV